MVEEGVCRLDPPKPNIDLGASDGVVLVDVPTPPAVAPNVKRDEAVAGAEVDGVVAAPPFNTNEMQKEKHC